MPTLTQGPRRALNTLTTVLTAEVAADAQTICTDDLSRRRPPGSAPLPGRAQRALNARAHVLRLQVATGSNYQGDGSKTLAFARYDMQAEALVMACRAETVHDAQVGAFRPRTQTA